MSNYYNTFKFIGEFMLPKKDAKIPLISQGTIKNTDCQMIKLNFGIKASDHNAAFVECFDTVKDNIKTKDLDGNDIEIPWEDRFKPDSENMVANYRKYTVNLGDNFGGRKDFITQYDMIKFLGDILPKYEGRLYITGQYQRKPYKNKLYNHFVVQNVYAVDKEDKRKDKFTLFVDVFYNKDSYDSNNYKKTGKLYLNGYVLQYIDKNDGIKYIPQQFMLNTAKIDYSNEEHVKKLNYRIKEINVNNKTFVHVPWEITYVRGAEEVEFDESMLTSAQKEQIELGMKTADDFKPKSIYGNNIEEFRLSVPILTNDFKDGVVDTKLSEKDFMEKVFQFVQDESINDVLEKSEKSIDSEGETENVDIEDDDLFD